MHGSPIPSLTEVAFMVTTDDMSLTIVKSGGLKSDKKDIFIHEEQQHGHKKDEEVLRQIYNQIGGHETKLATRL